MAPVLLAATVPACSGESEPSRFGQECASFTFDPEHPYYAGFESFTDPDVLAWETATPGDVGIDAAVLDAAGDEAALSHDLASLLVARDGKLVYERYFNGSGPAESNDVHSLSKSILSVLTGQAISDGKLALDTEIGELLPTELVGAHGDLTVAHLLTMSGGLELRDPESDYESPSSTPATTPFVQAVLARPSVAPAGSEFAYSTGLTQVLAGVVTEAVDESLCTYAAERLFGPLGIDVERWWVETGGYFSGGHSLYLTPRELARFGQLVLQHGEWEGAQLVPAAWLDESLAERWDIMCLRNPPVREGYGYLWWRFDVGGHEVWVASGFGGQEVAIVEDLGLVVVVTHDTSAASMGEVVPAVRLLHHFVLEAVEGKPPRPSERCDEQTFDALTVRPDGSARTSLTEWTPGAMPWSWSPDGTRLAVQLERLNTEIATTGSDGSDPQRVTRDFAWDGMPAWSPVGDTLAFARGGPTDGDLYVTGAGGGDAVQLTDFAGSEQAPTWSPDGRRIAFVWSQRDTRGFGESGPLWVVDADGSNRDLLLGRDVGDPAWSPDGGRIALELRGTEWTETHLGILHLADGTVDDLGEGYLPNWSPDGSRLVYVTPRDDGGTDIATISPDGTDRTLLTDDPVFDTKPLWSPDGTTILYLRRAL